MSVASEITEVEKIVIEAPDLLTASERLSRQDSGPPGFNFGRERYEEALEVRIGDQLIHRRVFNKEQLELVIAERKEGFPRVSARTLHLAMINLDRFPLNQIEELIADCDFDGLSVTVRGSQADERILDFIRRYDGKEISLTMEDNKLEPEDFLALPRLAELSAEWLSGFRGAWEEDFALSESLFLDLVKKRHAWIHLPVDIKDDKFLLEVIKCVASSDVAQRITLRLPCEQVDKILSSYGVKRTSEGKMKLKGQSEFTVKDGVLEYGAARIGFHKAYTRRFYGPGAMSYYLISIVREL